MYKWLLRISFVAAIELMVMLGVQILYAVVKSPIILGILYFMGLLNMFVILPVFSPLLIGMLVYARVNHRWQDLRLTLVCFLLFLVGAAYPFLLLMMIFLGVIN